MKQGDAEQESQARWDKWRELQDQINKLEGLVARGEQLREQYQARLAELHQQDEEASQRFASMIKKLQEQE